MSLRAVVRGAPAALLAAAALLPLGACGGRGGTVALAGTPGPPTIRVLLGGPRDSVAVAAPDEWRASALVGSSWSEAGSNLSAGLLPSAKGIVFRGTATGATSIRVAMRGAFSVQDEAGSRVAYRGDLLVRQDAGKLLLVDEVDLETYVAGVIVNEIGVQAVPASFRAQAVAARSYAYVQWKERPDAPHHLYDSTKSQVYRGVTLPPRSPVTVTDLDRFTAETRGVILTWRSEPFPTYYCSTCGGHTTDAETGDLPHQGFLEPLSGVPCKYCTPSKYFAWTETVPLQRIVDGLKDRGVAAPIRSIELSKYGRGGWVSEVTLVQGPKGTRKVVPAPAFRSAAGLRSMHIVSVEPGDGFVVVSGNGWGHGVGMCQVGCQEMGRKGLNETEILRYYYPGAEFTRIY